MMPKGPALLALLVLLAVLAPRPAVSNRRFLLANIQVRLGRASVLGAGPS
jgi:hypothetical protein